MATIVGPLLNPDGMSLGAGDHDSFLTLLDLQPTGLPLRLDHCDCEGCQVGEVVDVMKTANGRSWAVATTDLRRERCEGRVFSLGARVIDDDPPDLVTPRLIVLTEVSLVDRSGSCTTPVRWQPDSLRSWDRGGYVQGTTADERQVLDHAASRLDFQQRAGVIEVITLPDRNAPKPVTTLTRSSIVDEDDTVIPLAASVARGRDGSTYYTRYFPNVLKLR